MVSHLLGIYIEPHLILRLVIWHECPATLILPHNSLDSLQPLGEGLRPAIAAAELFRHPAAIDDNNPIVIQQ